MKTDAQIQKDVMDQLKWEPYLTASEIGVAVKNGVVTLSGQVSSYSKKIAAENAAKKIKGVKAIAEDIQIGVSAMKDRTDTEVATAVLNALKWHTGVQDEKVKIKVENGIVKLEGEVDWEYQKSNAKTAIENLSGVRSVINLISVKPRVTSANIEQKISSAFHRSATIDSDRIVVDVQGSRVILKGSVRSYAEKEDAEDAAWAAPGVTAVDNRIEIKIPEYAY